MLCLYLFLLIHLDKLFETSEVLKLKFLFWIKTILSTLWFQMMWLELSHPLLTSMLLSFFNYKPFLLWCTYFFPSRNISAPIAVQFSYCVIFTYMFGRIMWVNTVDLILLPPLLNPSFYFRLIFAGYRWPKLTSPVETFI